MSIKRFFDIVTPRFITEEAAAVIEPDGSIQPICAANDLREGEHYDKIVVVKFFNFFGIALFCRIIGEKS